MTVYTRTEILENRRAWIGYLKLPTTEKQKGCLEASENNSARCCLGHACHVLIPETRRILGDMIYYGTDRGYAPLSVQQKLGLYDFAGAIGDDTNEKFVIGSYEPKFNLAALNDDTDITPQEIGAYLETVIEGGENTPFRPLSEYPE